MVLQKRLDNGSSGYHMPPMPRFPVSARGKRSIRKKHEDNQISAFDLLATVAGELLSEKENSVSEHIVVNDSIKKEQQDNEIPSKAEVFDQGSCNESTLGSEILSSKQPQIPKSLNGESGELVLGGKRKEFGCSLPQDSKKICTVVGVKTPLQAERRMAVNAVDGNSPEVLEDPMYLDANKPPALVSSDSSVEVPIYCTGSFPILPVNRDDDENSSGCTHPRIRPQRIGDRRIRKLLASKFWKVPQRTSQNGEISNADVEMRSVFRSRKMCYTRERTQRSSFKRKKLFERRSISEAVCNSLKLGGIKMEASGAHASSNGVNGPSSLTSGQKSSYESGDYHVKLSIKSFKVPELFIEIPETATVGSLKRTVMEAVTAILSGGLRVGVLLQGKKVRDDKQTLLQAGISHNNRMDNLGFTLEPNSTQTPPPLPCTEDPNPLLPINAVLPCPPPMELVRRIPVADPVVVQVPPQTAPAPPQSLNLNFHESDHDSVQSPTSSLLLDKGEDSKAVVPVPVPAANADTSAVVPLRNKSKRSDLAQRRIRRPFSVTEVEALVQAVEKLGTGRWRDVKIGAFDNAKHRTYVDLKDKWKTLVHTARISPQQRRGEPVPQELLDRVLSAHAYWIHQQSKPTHSEVRLI